MQFRVPASTLEAPVYLGVTGKLMSAPRSEPGPTGPRASEPSTAVPHTGTQHISSFSSLSILYVLITCSFSGKPLA